MRALAALYTTAGDTTRASILLDRAISLCKAASDKNQSRDLALLYLDKAWLEASQSHFAEAQNYFKQSMETIAATKVPGLSRDLNTFNRQYMCTAVKLAQCYRSKGKPALAEEALKAIISRIESGKSWLGVFDQSGGDAPDRSIPNLYYYYGRLLADKGDVDVARSYLDKAITASKNNVPGVMRFVRAKVAAAQQDYECAALDYSDVSQESFDNNVQALIMMQPNLKESYCRFALEFALKAKKLNGEELAKIYTRLAEGGRKVDAEVIGKLFLDKAGSLYGKQSAEYWQPLTVMFNLYAGQKDFKTANQYLDQILAIDPRKFELGRSASGHFSGPEDMAFGLTLKEDTRAYGMEVLNKILIVSSGWLHAKPISGNAKILLLQISDSGLS